MDHIRFFDHNNSENVFIESIKSKSHWLLLGSDKETCRPINNPIPLYNILLDLPDLRHTAWLIVTLDTSSLHNESFIDWLTQRILSCCPGHLDVLFIIQPEDPLLSMERIVNDQSSELQTIKSKCLPLVAKIIQNITLYKTRYYYLFTPDILIKKYQESTKSETILGSSQFLELKTEEKRYFYMYKLSLEYLSQELTSLIVGWVTLNWFHAFLSLSREQESILCHANINLIYCDFDWTPSQFVSLLIANH